MKIFIIILLLGIIIIPIITGYTLIKKSKKRLDFEDDDEILGACARAAFLGKGIVSMNVNKDESGVCFIAHANDKEYRGSNINKIMDQIISDSKQKG